VTARKEEVKSSSDGGLTRIKKMSPGEKREHAIQSLRVKKRKRQEELLKFGLDGEGVSG